MMMNSGGTSAQSEPPITMTRSAGMAMEWPFMARLMKIAPMTSPKNSAPSVAT